MPAGISPISSSSSQRAFGGFDEKPRTGASRIGERALDVPEELALEQILGHRSAIDRDERTVFAAAALVDCLCDELFAGSALACDKGSGFCLGDARDEVIHLPHGVARTENVVELLAVGHHAAQALDLVAQRAVLQRSLERECDFVHLERFGYKIVRSGSDRSHGRLHASVSRHHDDRYVLAALDDLPTELDAVH